MSAASSRAKGPACGRCAASCSPRRDGRTIDLGAGTGANLGLSPGAVGDLVLVEPDRQMLRRLRHRLDGAARAAELIEVPAERLPFPDDDFDSAVFTLVLCTVRSPAAALAEAAPVLHPAGLVLEHVDRGALPKALRFLRPLVWGSAMLAS